VIVMRFMGGGERERTELFVIWYRNDD